MKKLVLALSVIAFTACNNTPKEEKAKGKKRKTVSLTVYEWLTNIFRVDMNPILYLVVVEGSCCGRLVIRSVRWRFCFASIGSKMYESCFCCCWRLSTFVRFRWCFL